MGCSSISKPANVNAVIKSALYFRLLIKKIVVVFVIESVKKGKF